MICFAITVVAGCGAWLDRSSTPAATTDSLAAMPAQTAGLKSDRPPVAMPSLHRGDVWVDRVEGSDREFRIEDIQDDTMDVDFWGTEMTTDTALNIIVFNSLTNSSSEPTRNSKPSIWFAFPLYPGKPWTNKFSWEYQGAAPAQGKAEDHGKVLNWEDVTVPAGKFHALKVSVTSRYFGAGGANDESVVTFWYAPEVNRFVKLDYQDTYDGTLLAELVRYKPSPPDN